MAAGRISIDDRIRKAEEKRSKIKEKYDAAADELKMLLEKKEEQKRKELLSAFEKSGRTYEEIMEFLESGTKKKPAEKKPVTVERKTRKRISAK